MMSPDIFKDNILIQLVEQCSIRDKLRSCTEVWRDIDESKVDLKRKIL